MIVHLLTCSPKSLSPGMFSQPFYLPVHPVFLYVLLLFRAQAFQAVYGSFAAWLRDTERKIQRDDSLKLELSALSSGRSYLKVVC